jgi:hypothetical protein
VLGVPGEVQGEVERGGETVTRSRTKVAALEVEERTCGGDDCPVRSTAKNAAGGYCEGCPSVERWCRGCHRYRPQTGWWWGMTSTPSGGVPSGMVGWVCSGCRAPAPSPAELAKYPSRADHPALAAIAAANPVFDTELVLDPMARAEVVSELSRSRGPDGPASAVLARMAAQVRADGYDGRLEVDVADVDLVARGVVLTLLHRAAYGSTVHSPGAGAQQPLVGLLRAWETWLDAQYGEERPAPEPTRAERDAAEAASRRRHLERKVS